MNESRAVSGSAPQQFAQVLSLVDHHCHGVVRGDLDRGGFEALISEGGPPAAGTTNFDTPLGMAIRRHCAPVLELPPHTSPEEYMRRRIELGTEEVTGRLMGAAGLSELLVDTGLQPERLLSPTDLGRCSGARAREVVRLETVAESIAEQGVEPGEFADRFATALAHTVASTNAVAVKSVAAYRIGFDFDPSRPSTAEVTAAVSGWRSAAPTPGRARLDDPVLTRELLWHGIDLGLPIQLHAGFGDPDLVLHRANPALLTGFIRLVPERIPIMLLHNYPYHREASYLAAVYPHVYLDVGLALNYVGPSRAAAVLAEALELTPLTKMLYSSDAFGLPELYYLGALVFRRGLDRLLQQRIESDECTDVDARRIAALFGYDNARRAYRLDDSTVLEGVEK
jgi:predicted TIM-barrel fold metal-dependent hydrolase